MANYKILKLAIFIFQFLIAFVVYIANWNDMQILQHCRARLHFPLYRSALKCIIKYVVGLCNEGKQFANEIANLHLIKKLHIYQAKANLQMFVKFMSEQLWEPN